MLAVTLIGAAMEALAAHEAACYSKGTLQLSTHMQCSYEMPPTMSQQCILVVMLEDYDNC